MFKRTSLSVGLLILVLQLTRVSSQVLGTAISNVGLNNVLGGGGNQQSHQESEANRNNNPPITRPTMVQSPNFINGTNNNSPAAEISNGSVSANAPPSVNISTMDTSSLPRSLGERPSFRKEAANKKVLLGTPLYQPKKQGKEAPDGQESSSSAESSPSPRRRENQKESRKQKDAKKLKLLNLFRKLKSDSSSELASVSKELIDSLSKKSKSKKRKGKSRSKYSDSDASELNDGAPPLSSRNSKPSAKGRSIMGSPTQLTQGTPVKELEDEVEVEPTRPKPITKIQPNVVEPIEDSSTENPLTSLSSSSTEDEKAPKSSSSGSSSMELSNSKYNKLTKIIVKGGENGQPSVIIVPQNIYNVKYTINREGNQQKITYRNSFSGKSGKLTKDEMKAMKKGVIQSPVQSSMDYLDTSYLKPSKSGETDGDNSFSSKSSSGSSEKASEELSDGESTLPKIKTGSKKSKSNRKRTNKSKKKVHSKPKEKKSKIPAKKVSDIFKEAEAKAKIRFAAEEAERLAAAGNPTASSTTNPI